MTISFNHKNFLRAFRRSSVVGGAGLLAASLLATGASAAELTPGYVINSGNLDQALESTFDGTRVADMLPERMQWLVRNQGLTIPLGTPQDKLPFPERITEATEKYAGQARLKDNLMLENYRAGIPFPDVDLNDPQAGAKVVWNHIHGRPRNGDGSDGTDILVLIDGESGSSRLQRWHYTRWYGAGRITDEVPQVDPPILYKELLFARTPQDIRGLGTLTIRWNEDRFDAIWAYVRTVRRIRRLSGGAWLDAIGGTDFLRDDIEFNALPAWYEGFKVVGTRRILAMTWPDGASEGQVRQMRGYAPEGDTLGAQMPLHDVKTAPYWNPVIKWIPREVYVVDALTPIEHPYGRKLAYFDTVNYNYYATETFDKKGEFWKWQMQSFAPVPSTDGYVTSEGKPEIWLIVQSDNIYDFQRMHGTIYAADIENRSVNDLALAEEDVSAAVLEQAGR